MRARREHGGVAVPLVFTGIVAALAVGVAVVVWTIVAPLSTGAAVFILLAAGGFAGMGLLFFWRARPPQAVAGGEAPAAAALPAQDDEPALRIQVVEVPAPARRPEPIPLEELSDREFS